VSENGSKGKACSDSRRLAVVPVGDIEQPMLLRVPAGTLKDLAEYAKMLNRRQVGYQAVVTKVAFDHTVAHQKFTFKAVRFVTPEEADTIRELGESETVQQILGLAPAPARSQDDGLGETPEHLKPKPVAKPKARHEVSEDEVAAAVSVAKPKPKKAVVEEAEEPAETPAPRKIDRERALAEATASLDDVLGALDD
jgi:outer membrane biosynthesis protein TonB